ncbi:hypothetical protein GL50803_0015847 [Giardia duodenalis]|uniref:Uncharacterized protein n=1 Tax=Giardia intestinalis (strain ATCC 50803 / WB clone C6) TaxID=184922 RepID=A8BZ00_GIAIC|nr:uncharacterized protein GL50803_0015847 [Giardia intestinalis]KAE8304840.1 hypothetical protein GL50803_0015847 [Giardia intestinalis]|eukprot:XP_001704107.1 Hypothetical protein GL50803_15847 [Giardia lamblia ATCC 50803]
MPSKQTFGYETALENKEGEGLTHIADSLANCKWLIDLQKEFKAALDHYTKDFQKLVDASVAPHPKTLPFSENFIADSCSSVCQTLEKLSEQFEAQSISKLEDAYKENTKELATLKATMDKSFKERAKLDSDKHKTNTAMTTLSHKLDGSEPSSSTLKEKARLEKKSEEITEQLADVNKRFVGLRNQMETLDWEVLQGLITASKVTGEELGKAGSKLKAIGEEIEKKRHTNNAQESLEQFLKTITAAEKDRCRANIV